MTTNRIAEHAGVSVGSIYQYFGDKQAIFEELAARHLDDSAERLTQALSVHGIDDSDWETVVGDLVAAAVDVNAEHGRAFGLLREIVSSPENIARYLALIDDIVDRLSPYLVAAGRTPDDAAADVRMAMSAIDAQIHQHVGQRGITRDQLVARITAYTVAAIRDGL